MEVGPVEPKKTLKMQNSNLQEIYNVVEDPRCQQLVNTTW